MQPTSANPKEPAVSPDDQALAEGRRFGYVGDNPVEIAQAAAADETGHVITGHVATERDGTPYAYYRCQRCGRESTARPPWNDRPCESAGGAT